MAKLNQAWNLESFLDSLTVELDKARETLALKAINRPLTYAVKDVNLEMQLFPSFDGRQVRFVTAEPGQTGASKIAIQLASITDQQIRQSSKKFVTKDDINIEVVDGIDDETKQTLRKIGVTSINDLEEIEKKNIDLEKISNKQISYTKLSGLLQKAHRGNLPPMVKRASLSGAQGTPFLILEGENLALNKDYEPIAVINGHLAEIISSNKTNLTIKINPEYVLPHENEVVMALDPFAIFKVKINYPS